VARGNCPFDPGGLRGFDEHFAEWHRFVGEIVIAERAGLIGIVQDDQPPAAG
jgi:hypothetical protein